MTRTLLLLPLALLLLAAPPALASEPDAKPEAKPETHKASDAPQRQYFVGTKFQVLAGLHDGHASSIFGAGAFFEFTIADGFMAIEGAMMGLLGEKNDAFAIEILAKKPFHAAEWAEPYVGVGVILVIPTEGEIDPHVPVHSGLATVAGTYFWVGKNLGLLLEFNYNLLIEEDPVSEVGGAFGVAYGW